MSHVPTDFKTISQECYDWSLRCYRDRKEIKCRLEDIDVNIVLVRRNGVTIPNRIYVWPDDQKIQEIFKEHLYQPDSSMSSNANLRPWIFKDHPNSSSPSVQYELRFCSNEGVLNVQLEAKLKETPSECAIA